MKTVKILYYNHVYGTNGRNFLSFLRTHFYHIRGKPEKVREKSDLTQTLQLIKKINPDIFVISEVLGEKQRRLLIKKLETRYNYFHTGKGHRLGNTNQYVEILIGTKDESKRIDIPHISIPPHWGNGGGMVCINIPQLKLTVMGVHLALQKRKDSFSKQISVLHNTIKASGQYILLGDFNTELKELCSVLPLVKKFKQLSPNQSTCSQTNIIKWFVKHSIDHILGLNVKLMQNKAIIVNSDHKAVTATIALNHNSRNSNRFSTHSSKTF